MHYLVWNQEQFEISQKESTPDLNEEIGEHLFPWVRHSPGRVDYRSWKNFLEERPQDAPLDPLLLESWRRCAQMGVDPSPRKCWEFLDQGLLAESAARLKELTGDLEPRLDKLVRDMGLIVNIINPGSYIVQTYGHPRTLLNSNHLNFGPGANWSESSVGTNAIGTSLATGRAVQIFDQEHFCQSHHNWRCTAAPFYDPHGEAVGCFDISGPSEGDHSKALNLVLWATRTIEHRLLREHAQDLSTWPLTLLRALPPGLAVGFVVLDRWGQVVGASEAAAIMLGRRPGNLMGRPGEELFDLGPYLQRVRSGLGADQTPVRCRGQAELAATAQGLQSVSGYGLGTLVSLVEPAGRRWPGPGQAEAVGPARRDREFIGRSAKSAEVLALARGLARTNSTVLIEGETGTGKELVARLIHSQGPRRNGPFVAVNCGALSRELIQSELFGYVGGAFTGAERAGRAGFFEEARGGVIFLDEISEMPLELQPNLLRVLEEKAVTRVGGGRPIPVDVKVVAATNRGLADEAAAGRFRADLFYRLNVAVIRLPALRERPEDIEPLLEHHLARLAGEMGLPVPELDPSIRALFRAQTWPGNVRALVGAVEYALNRLCALDGDRLGPEHLPPEFTGNVPAGLESSRPPESASAEGVLKEAELRTIESVVAECRGNLSRAARMLGISRTTLYAKLGRTPGSRTKG